MMIQAEPVSCLVREVFVAAGCSREESARIGDYLVRAILTSHDSHGVIRVPRYLNWMAEGGLWPDRALTVITDNPAMTPHSAAYTGECNRRSSLVSAQNVLDALDGRLDPELVVNKEVLS